MYPTRCKVCGVVIIDGIYRCDDGRVGRGSISAQVICEPCDEWREDVIILYYAREKQNVQLNLFREAHGILQGN